MKTVKSIPFTPPVVAVLLAIGLFFLGGILNPGFVNPDQAINIVRLSAFLGIIAAGQTLVILSGGEGIDLSIGAVVTLAAILTFRINDGQNSLVLWALAVVLAVGAAIGFSNGLGIALLKIPPLVMTLGMAGVVQGLLLAITQGILEGDTAPIMSRLIARPLFLGIPGVIFIWLVLAALIWLLLERTTYGKQLFGIGVNRVTSRLSGVRVPVVVVLTYTLSGLLAAFGGFMLLGFTGTVFLNLGGPFLFPTVAAVVVGGTALAGGKGSYFGTMAGALVLTLLTSLLTTMQLPEAFSQIILGVTLLVLISVYGRQRGLRQ
ncbi:MAG: ABC transporter permease [Chloroflexi bacterium]|nr:ABC transporter permease [Chloroflexota bacterium]MCI0579604.1 ABC transporter permease [Chloroflexota bacterium]MCI0644835.1 ABC transporter permease [Chloroflexota bacterium]MCI0731439.1 ABC transporter permease [Chloroflexota bacterium]